MVKHYDDRGVIPPERWGNKDGRNNLPPSYEVLPPRETLITDLLGYYKLETFGVSKPVIPTFDGNGSIKFEQVVPNYSSEQDFGKYPEVLEGVREDDEGNCRKIFVHPLKRATVFGVTPPKKEIRNNLAHVDFNRVHTFKERMNKLSFKELKESLEKGDSEDKNILKELKLLEGRRRPSKKGQEKFKENFTLTYSRLLRMEALSKSKYLPELREIFWHYFGGQTPKKNRFFVQERFTSGVLTTQANDPTAIKVEGQKKIRMVTDTSAVKAELRRCYNLRGDEREIAQRYGLIRAQKLSHSRLSGWAVKNLAKAKIARQQKRAAHLENNLDGSIFELVKMNLGRLNLPCPSFADGKEKSAAYQLLVEYKAADEKRPLVKAWSVRNKYLEPWSEKVAQNFLEKFGKALDKREKILA